MTNAITTQLLMNSSRQYILLYNVVADGSGDLAASLVLKTSGDLPTTAKLVRIIYSTGSSNVDTTTSQACFSSQLLWKATTNTMFFNLADNHSDDLDFRDLGGLPNPVNSGANGDVLLTTTGMIVAGDTISMLLEFRKS